MIDFKGKVAVITGATGGIGRATAKLLHAQGARLVLGDLDAGALEELAKQCGSDAVWVTCDVSKEADNEALAQKALDSFGQVDAVILNAGIEGKAAPIGEIALEDFERVLAVNVRGVFLGLKTLMPKMERSGGSIVILSSIAGRRGTARMAPYITSKHAVVGLMRTAAIEGAEHGIRVNTVNPGPIATRMMEQIEKNFAPDDPSAAHQSLEKTIPLGRYGTAEEVANLIAFLASDAASYCSGNMYGVDGAKVA